ncbi:MAG: hypothetical protein KF774_06270 [Planctomyces sp.]|nr:hypothetical protein [Planctomyces sp.]
MALAASLLAHCVLLAIFALHIVGGGRSESAIDTLVQTGDDGGAGVGEMISVDLTPLLPTADVSTLHSPLTALADAPLDVAAEGLGSIEGSGSGGLGAEDGFFNLPKNAVRAGSFAAWTTPQGLDNLGRRIKPPGEPGEAPEPREMYHITIQIRLPKNNGSYSLSDLTGSVVGTDDYRQRIPRDVFIKGRRGKLVKTPETGTLPAKNGVVELIVAVPGGDRLVEDTIELRSKLLDESQTLTLTFGG